MFASRLPRFVFFIGLAMHVLSCDVAGGLFSQSELADMYDVWIDMDGLPLKDGNLVRANASLVPVVEPRGGFSSPERLSLVLVDEDGVEAARLGFLTESGSRFDTEEDPSLGIVGSIEGSLPSFSFPDDLAEGYYSLEIRLYDSVDRILSNTSILVLVYNGDMPAPRIEIFPSSPAKGQPVFLRLVSGLSGELDPWLRWYVGGVMRREGYASEFADRLVWQLPEADGFLSVRAELFPYKPPAEISNRSISTGESHSSAFRTDLILAIGPAQPASLLAAIDRLHFVDFKSEPETLMMTSPGGTPLPVLMVGRPYLESHEHGYGHALREGAGYLIPGTILPQSGTPFSLGITFDPLNDLGDSGALVTLYGTDGATSFMRLGVSGGLPYLEVGDSIVQAYVGLPAGLCRLVVEVLPPETDTTESIVTLFLNDELAGNGSVPYSLFEQAGPVTTLVAGPDGLDAVYDELAVTIGRYQAFFIAETYEFGNRLVAASGFEGGAIGKGISVQGPAKAGDGFIELSSDAGLEIPVPAGGFTIEIEGYGSVLDLILVMDDDSTVILQRYIPVPVLESEAVPRQVLGTVSAEFPGVEPGEVTGTESKETTGTESKETTGTESKETTGTESTGLTAPTSWSADQPIFISVEVVSGGLRISDDAGRNENLPNSRKAAVLRLQAASSTSSTIQTVSVRTFNPLDSVNRTASTTALVPSDGGN